MSRVDELIARLCPSGVVHRALGEVAHYSDGRVDATELDATTFVGVDNLVANKGGKMPANYLPNTERLTAFRAGDVLIGNIRPYLKKVWLATGSGGCSGDVLAVRITGEHAGSLSPKFLYYLLSSDRFFAYDMQHAKGAKMPRGSKAAILSFRIPVPPPAIQREVVRILDQFIQLEAELEAELEARRRQYEHYRESLLSSDESGHVRWSALGEVGEFFRGRRFTKEDRDADGVASIHYGEIYTSYGTSASEVFTRVRRDLAPTLRFAGQGDVVIASVGETVADVGKALAWLGDEAVAIHDDCFAFRSPMDAKFVAYALQTTSVRVQKEQFVARAKVKRIAATSLAKIKIPVPSLAEQRRTVAKLDAFDRLVNDLAVGLPAELEARRTQYEHYRDRLLTFEELAA